jgi:hypothetical protein
MRGLAIGSGEASVTVPRLSGVGVELQVLRVELRRRAVKAACLGDRGRQPPTVGLDQLAHAALVLERGAQQGHRIDGPPDCPRREMVLKVAADGGQIVDRAHIGASQQRGIADSGEHEQLRRVVGAGAQQDLALRPRVQRLAVALARDGDRARSLKEDPVRLRARAQLEVRATQRGVQVRAGRRAAPAVALRDLIPADAILLAAVEVVVAPQSRLDGGLDERGRDRGARTSVGDAQRTAGAVERIGAALVVLRTLEVGQQVVEAPGIDVPAVVVGAAAARVDHRVDR